MTPILVQWRPGWLDFLEGHADNGISRGQGVVFYFGDELTDELTLERVGEVMERANTICCMLSARRRR